MYRQTFVVLIIVITLLGSILSPIAHAQTKFSDLDEKKYGWAMGSINFMNDHGVLKGYPDGTFKPEGTVTKAELTVMIYRLFDRYRPNLNTTGYEKILGFPDVPVNHWALKEISEIYNYPFNWGGAISVDDSSGKFIFRPELPLTRLYLTNMLYSFFDSKLIAQISDEEIFQLVSRLKDIPTKQFSNEDEFDRYRQTDGRYSSSSGIAVNTEDKVFPILFNVDQNGDLYISDDYSSVQGQAVASMQSQGIITADALSNFRPVAPITRAEVVTILYRIYNLLQKNGILQNYSTQLTS